MKSILIYFFLFVCLAEASPPAPIQSKPVRSGPISFGNTQKWFMTFQKQRLTLSENCGSSLEGLSCLAAQSIKLATLRKARPEQLASRNPGSWVCKQILNARVVIGVDSHRNENSFCLFKDDSLIDTGSLTYYAGMNDRKNHK